MKTTVGFFLNAWLYFISLQYFFSLISSNPSLHIFILFSGSITREERNREGMTDGAR